MKLIWSAVLYTALAMGANAADLDVASLEALREGTMKKLTFHSEPQATSEATFTDPEGGEFQLADYKGKYVLLNFWATWCAPCRHEMPALNALQVDYGGDGFAVVPVATGRNTLSGITRFFGETDIDALPILLDPKQSLARDMAVLGLPVTVLIDPEGREIARMRGDAEWAGESARAILAQILGSS
jgi:thiol-disulfide isomerase/thioredoxin